MEELEQVIEVERPRDANLSFSGRLVAEARSAVEGTIRVYKTQGGRYVLEQRKPALRSPPIHRVEIIDTKADLGCALP